MSQRGELLRGRLRRVVELVTLALIVFIAVMVGLHLAACPGLPLW